MVGEQDIKMKGSTEEVVANIIALHHWSRHMGKQLTADMMCMQLSRIAKSNIKESKELEFHRNEASASRD